MKKRLLLVLLVLVVFLTGCDTYAMFDRYPWDKADQWYCEEIDSAIKYLFDANGNLSHSVASLTWDGQEYNGNVGFLADHFDFYKIESGRNETLFAGSWKYEEENMVFCITEDNLFDGKYTELVFVPQ